MSSAVTPIRSSGGILVGSGGGVYTHDEIIEPIIFFFFKKQENMRKKYLKNKFVNSSSDRTDEHWFKLLIVTLIFSTSNVNYFPFKVYKK